MYYNYSIISPTVIDILLDSINKTLFSEITVVFTFNQESNNEPLWKYTMYSYQHVIRTQGELNKQSNIYTNSVGLYRKR